MATLRSGQQNSADLSTCTFVALKQMNIGGAVRYPGQAVPEASGWRNVHNYISAGYIAISGGPTANPNQSTTKVGKATGKAEHEYYQPTDHLGAVSKPAVDHI